ncbi:hypothetical protein ACT16_06625 [Mycobacterium heckeshornense]|nr:hypothetical protein ACT16_06625 [Mycobacterium heckeshornense]
MTKVFLPGTPVEQLPDWALARLGEHCFTEDAVNNEPVGDDTKPRGGGSGDGPPPQAGAGGGRDVWAAYAERHGVNVPEDYRRSQIIEACRNAGVPVE